MPDPKPFGDIKITDIVFSDDSCRLQFEATGEGVGKLLGPKWEGELDPQSVDVIYARFVKYWRQRRYK